MSTRSSSSSIDRSIDPLKETRKPLKKKKNVDIDNLPPTEEVLLLEGPVPTEQVNELLQILNGLSSGDDTNIDKKRESKSSDNGNKTTGEDDMNEKRKSSDNTAPEGKEEAGSNKKQKADETK